MTRFRSYSGSAPSWSGCRDLELQKWLSLPDRQLTFNCSDPEMDAANMNTAGFYIPGPVLQRVRRLRIRVMIGFHPAADVIQNVIY